MGKKKKKPPDLKPDLEKFLPEEKRKYVTYAKGALLYGVDKSTFARWAKSANATMRWKTQLLVDLDILNEYLQREKTTTKKSVYMRIVLTVKLQKRMKH